MLQTLRPRTMCVTLSSPGILRFLAAPSPVQVFLHKGQTLPVSERTRFFRLPFSLFLIVAASCVRRENHDRSPADEVVGQISRV